MQINLEELAELSKLELSTNELKTLAADMESIIDFVGEISSLPLSYESVPERNRNVFREDETLGDQLCDAKDLITSAPHNYCKFVSVSKVIDN